jgi:DNA-binding SARP family transcriptional activator
MARMNLVLLGGFEARSTSGRRLRVVRAKAKALVAYLALHPERVFARDKLAALLWPEFPEDDARHSLRQTLFTLRSLGLHVVATDPDTVTLPSGAVATDVDTFQRLIARGTSSALSEAVELYRGDLLEGLRVSEVTFDDWLLGHRERLRELAVDALRKLIAHARRTGRAEDAIRVASKLVALDPLQESGHRLLMELFATTGRRARALLQYQRCIKILQGELGVAPEPETRSLYHDILERRLTRRSRDHPSPVASGDQQGAIPMLGRQLEMEVLSQALSHVWDAKGGVALIVGETGVGKTRLTEELADAAHRRGGRVLVGRCYEMERILAFAPWTDVLRSAVTIEEKALQELSPLLRREIARLLPGAGDHDLGALAPDDHQIRLFQAIVQIVGQLARAQPLVLIIEDLHWADEPSLRLLSFIAHRLHGERVLIVGTVREEELDDNRPLRQLLNALDRDLSHTRLRLKPLSRDDTATLMHRLTATSNGGGIPVELERVWEASEGNPFVTIEMVRDVQENRAAEAGSKVPLPTRVSEIIANRLEQLEERASTLVAIAAVIGRDFEPGLLQRAAGLPVAAVAAGVETLARRHVLVVRGNRLDFAHDRVREVAANRLTPVSRTMIHAQVAAAIEDLYAGDRASHAGQLAMHYRDGEIWDKALEYLAVAGRQAAARGAKLEAARCFEQALDALEHLPADRVNTELAVDLRLDLRNALYALGDVDRALQNLVAAERLSMELADTARLAKAVAFMSHTLWFGGQASAARAQAERAVAMAEALGDGALCAMSGYFFGQACVASGDYYQAAERFAEVARWTDADRSRERVDLWGSLAGLVRAWRAQALAEVGDFEAAIASGCDAMKIAEALDDGFSLGFAGIALGVVYRIRGDLPRAIENLERVRALSTRYELDVFRFPVTRNLGDAYARTGRLPEGLALLRQALAMLESIGHRRPHATVCLDQLGRACLLDGRVDEARELAMRALTQARARGERGFEAYGLRLLADIAAHREELAEDEAEAHYREATALAAELGMRPLIAHCHLGLGKLYRRTGKRQEAQEHLTTATTMYREMGMRFWLEQAEKEMGELC